MGRIRTIKPELPHSESLGSVSRDARLSLILLLTLADDSGRTRGAFAYLSGQLFPYDQDALKMLPEWLRELDDIGSIVVYDVGKNRYIQITNWHKHQKIEKPTPSKIPEFDDSSPNCRRVFGEESTTDLGPRTMDLVPRIKTPLPPSSEKPEPAKTEETALPGAAPSSLSGELILADSQEPAPELPAKPRKPLEPIMIPDVLAASEDFLEAWEEWQRHRREIKKPLTPTQRNRQLIEMAEKGPDKSTAAIRFTIGKGWQGLVWPEERNGNGQFNQQATGVNGRFERTLTALSDFVDHG